MGSLTLFEPSALGSIPPGVVARRRRAGERQGLFDEEGTVLSMVKLRYASRPLFVAVALVASLLSVGPAAHADPSGVVGKPRVIVTTDPEKDDTNSLIRYLLFSDWFDTEGLVLASSQFHWSGDGKGTTLSVPGREYTRAAFPGGNPCPCTSWRWPAGPNHIEQALDAYEQVYPNLKTHSAGYPTPASLRSVYRVGNIKFDGEMSEDTAGSNLIKQVLLDDKPGPVYLLAWGGQSTIARALKSIQDQYQGTAQWDAVYQKVSRKAILEPSGDQD